MEKIILNECKKVYTLETHRARVPNATLQFVQSKQEILDMKSLRDATDDDRIGIPVFTCYRIRPDGSRTDHTGKGASKTQAQVSLTMEAIERYSSEFKKEDEKKLVKESYNSLKIKCNALDPQELILSRFSDYKPNDELYWVQGYDLIKDEEILIPACCVYHPFNLDNDLLISSNTDGLASGNTIEEAIFHGLTEVIERDAWSIAKYTGEPRDALFIEDQADNQFILDIIEKFEKAEIQIVCKDITSDIGVPVIAAFSQDLIHEDMMPIDGFGAHLDPKVAMARALLELASTRGLLIQKHGIKGIKNPTPLYLQEESEVEDPRFYAYRQKSLGELEVGYSQDISKDIEAVAAKLEERGLQKIIVVDLTKPEIGIPTVRAIIPGMEAYCFDKTRIGERLFNPKGN